MNVAPFNIIFQCNQDSGIMTVTHGSCHPMALPGSDIVALAASCHHQLPCPVGSTHQHPKPLNINKVKDK